MRYNIGTYKFTRELFEHKIEIAKAEHSAENSKLFFKTSLENDNDFDVGSFGYEFLSSGGIRKTLANDYTIKHYPVDLNGTFTNTIVENLVLQKDYVNQVGPTIIEDFSDISRVSSSFSNYNLITSEQPYKLFWSGAYNSNNEAYIQFELNIDISVFTKIKIPMYIQELKGKLYYRIELEDNLGAKWSSTQNNLETTVDFYGYTINVSDVSGIDLTNIKYLRIVFVRNQQDEIFLEQNLSNRNADIVENIDIRQNFIAPEDAEISNIKVKAYKDNNTTTNLYIGLGTPIGEALSYAVLKPTDVTTTEADYILTLSTPFNVKKNFTYSIILKSNAVDRKGYRWHVAYQRSLVYWGESFNYEVNSSLYATLYTPPPSFVAYIKPILAEGDSTYVASGEYISPSIYLGQNVAGFKSITYNASGNVKLYGRTAASENDLTNATWIDITNGDTSGLTIYTQTYFQYRFALDEGNTIETYTTPDVHSIEIIYNTLEPDYAEIIFKDVNFEADTNFVYYLVDYAKNTGNIEIDVYVDDVLSDLQNGVIYEKRCNKVKIVVRLYGDAVLYNVIIVSDTNIVR